MQFKKIMVFVMALLMVVPIMPMDTSGDKVKALPESSGAGEVLTAVLSLAPFLFQLYAMKQQRDQMSSIRGVPVMEPLKSSINFKKLNRDVHGAMRVLSLFYKFPDKFKTKKLDASLWFFTRYWQSLGNWYNGISGYEKPCNGIILHGEPGCGKTELIRALAGEGVPVFSFSGSEIKQPFMGASEAMLKNIYNGADAYRYGGWTRWLLNMPLHPCAVVFLDEIDSIGQQRGGGNSHSGSHETSIINQLLTLLDGTKKYDEIVTIVATNRKDLLDTALVRSGRLDVKIEVKNPTKNEKKSIINKKFDGLSLVRSKSLDELFDGVGLEDLATSDCAHLPKLCNTIIQLDDLEKELKDDKIIRIKNNGLIGTKVFKEALVWMEKKQEQKDLNPYMYS